MFALKLKLVTAILSVSVSPGRHHNVYRSGADRYAVLGEGTIHTIGCTVSAEGLDVQVSRDGKWLTFYDRNGEREADPCMIGERPTVVVAPSRPIRRGIATTGEAQ